MGKKLLHILIIGLIFMIGSGNLKATTMEATPDSSQIRYQFAPMVVTGQRYAVPQQDVAASVSIITPVELQQMNINAVADAISLMTPGVFTTQKSMMGYGVAALAAGQITVRGIGGSPNTEVLILIDGRPDFQGIFGHPIGDAYQMDNVDHIEVLRGPASAVYGTNALGGVVNVITKKLTTAGFNTNLNVQYGSYNTQKYLLNHSGAVGKFQYFTAISHNASDGSRKKSDFNGQNYALKLGYTINNKFQLTFNGNVTPYTYHDPGADGFVLSSYFDKGEITRSSMDLTLVNDLGNSDGSIKIHSNFGKHKLSDGWRSTDQTTGIVLFQNFNLWQHVKTTVGIDLKRFGGEATSTNYGSHFQNESAGYLHLQKTFFKTVVAAAGIRLENNSNFGTEWVPKAGLVYHLTTNTSLRTSVAKGFCTPSIKDLYLFPIANKDLKPERLWNYEFGINQSFTNSLQIDLCGYYYKGDQFIQTAFIPALKKALNQNLGSNEAKGVEVSVRWLPINQLSTQVSYSYLDSKNTIPFAPNKFNFMANYSLDKFDICVYGEHVRELYASYQIKGASAKTEKMPIYTLINLKLQYSLLKTMKIALGVENVLDKEYQIMKGYPMPKRTFYSGIQYSL
jgi:outer membrane cobalamin receptor